MSLFAGLKEKLADKIAEFKASTGPQDPLDRQVAELVDKATSDELIAPDWTLNFAVVDFISTDVRLNSGRALTAIRRSLSKHNTKVQLLALTLLETCVKNCAAEFHVHLATSELWANIVKLAGDSSISRVDGEVRDKMLVLVEDFARALQPTQFQAAYEQLLDTGVDFPVRGTEDAVPILTPPAHHVAAAGGAAAAAAPAAAGAVPAAAGAAPAAVAGDGATGGGEAADPLAGVDEQDRAAIAAALQELEAEARAAQEAERVAAEAEAAERRQRQEQQAAAQAAEAEAQAAAALVAAEELSRAAALAGGAVQPGAEAGQEGLAAGGDAGRQQQQQQPGSPPAEPQQTAEERTAGLLETASNCTLLLSEMLASIPDPEPLAVREPYVAELVDTCVRLRSRLERELSRLEDEALLASALSQHEELARVLGRYEELLAAAESLVPTRPRNAAAVAAAHAALSTQGQGHAQGPGQGQGHGPGAGGQPGGAAPHARQASGLSELPAGQKVSQTAAAVAAALKEKFTGAFDKLVAAAAAARAPTAAAASAGAAAGAADPYGGVTVGGPLPPVQEGGEGTFTLLDDEDEANEATSLITKRTPAAAAPPPSYQPPSYYSPPSEQPHSQPWMQAPPPPQEQQPWMPSTGPAPSPPPPPPAAPDLICFDEEPSEVPQQPGALADAEASRSAAQVASAGAAADQMASLAVQEAPPLSTSPTAAAPAPQPAEPQALAHQEQQQQPPQQPTALAPVIATYGPVSRDGSHGDQLVAALDALVAQESVASTPQAPAAAAAAEAEQHHEHP